MIFTKLVHQIEKRRLSKKPYMRYKIPTKIVESFILVKAKRRKEKPRIRFSVVTLLPFNNWNGLARNTTDKLHFTKRKKEAITNRPLYLTPYRAGFLSRRSFISPEIVSRRDARKQGHGEAATDRSSPERKRARTDWPRRGYLPL